MSCLDPLLMPPFCEHCSLLYQGEKQPDVISASRHKKIS